MPREPEQFEVEVLQRVSRWRYVEHMELGEIHGELRKLDPALPVKVNRRRIRRMLEQALQRKVVVISYPTEETEGERLERELKGLFPHLERVIAIPNFEKEEYTFLRDRWGHEAAKYFDQMARERGAGNREMHVGLSGGLSLLSFVNAVTERSRQNVHIQTTALIGRAYTEKRKRSRAKRAGDEDDDEEFSHVDPLVNATILWSKCGSLPGHIHYSTVAPYVGLQRQQIATRLRQLAKNKHIRKTILAMNRIDVAFVGLGDIESNSKDPQLTSQLTMTGLLKDIVKPRDLRREGATGEIGYCLYDEAGKGLRDTWRFFLTAGSCDRQVRTVEFFRDMVEQRPQENKRVVVIAGRHKEEAILAGLRGHLFNVWITDEATARWAITARKAYLAKQSRAG